RPMVQRYFDPDVHAVRVLHVVAVRACDRHNPAPDPFLKAAEQLGVAPALCLALEDSHNGVRAASAAGMMTVMVPDLLPPTDEIRSDERRVGSERRAVWRRGAGGVGVRGGKLWG